MKYLAPHFTLIKKNKCGFLQKAPRDPGKQEVKTEETHLTHFFFSNWDRGERKRRSKKKMGRKEDKTK